MNIMAVKTHEHSHTIDDTYCTVLVKSFCKFETPEVILLWRPHMIRKVNIQAHNIQLALRTKTGTRIVINKIWHVECHQCVQITKLEKLESTNNLFLLAH